MKWGLAITILSRKGVDNYNPPVLDTSLTSFETEDMANKAAAKIAQALQAKDVEATFATYRIY
jgi:hypothetical protein